MLLLGNGEDSRRSACRAPFLTRLGQCSVSLRVGVCHPNTRTHVRLLGPCFKTGRANPAGRHHPGRAASEDAGGAPAEGSPRPGARQGSCRARRQGGAPCGGARAHGAFQWGREAPKEEPAWLACFQRFHVLFHFLSKVLFIFPSRYLFAIGLSQVFSLGRTLPPD